MLWSNMPIVRTVPFSTRWLAAAVLALMAGGCGGDARVEPDPPPLAPVAAAPVDTGLGQIVGTAPAVTRGVVSIVLLDPVADIDVPLPEEVAVMDQYGRMFNPGFLLVRAGQTVRFTNSEDDLHTVHAKDSASESLFNVATLWGSRYEYTFDLADDYKVVCNTHTEMEADIMVVSSPYAVVADTDGAFALPDVVPGIYTATLVRGTERHELQLEIVAGRNELDLTAL